MKKALIILTLLPLLASCGFNYQKSYNEAIRSTYPAYYYEASMEGFSNLHEKKENYMRVSQGGYYENYKFCSENYDPDFFPEIYEILKTSGGIKKPKYDSSTEKTFSYEIVVFYKSKKGYYSGFTTYFDVDAYEELGFYVVNMEYGDDDDWFPLRKQGFYAFTKEQSKALKDYISSVANEDENTDE